MPTIFIVFWDHSHQHSFQIHNGIKSSILCKFVQSHPCTSMLGKQHRPAAMTKNNFFCTRNVPHSLNHHSKNSNPYEFQFNSALRLCKFIHDFLILGHETLWGLSLQLQNSSMLGTYIVLDITWWWPTKFHGTWIHTRYENMGCELTCPPYSW
jgi:hypothetical protein